MASPLRSPPTPSEPDDDAASQQATVCAPPEDEDDERTENTPHAPLPYAAGTVISQKYELIRMLGEGGMGAVWVARNIALDAHVGLKLIRAEVSRNIPGAQGRLLQEARAAASLGHPAIIRVFDFGTTERGDPFIAMELLHGENLADLLQRRGKVGAVRAAQTLLPVIDALASAHATGIIHRDLKPDNIFVSREAGGRYQPKVLDFGIAKLERSVSPHLTREGTVLGSPAYMSPEQARGNADVDARSDIWAICVVLYQLMTGRLPFVADNDNALLWSIVEKPPLPFTELGVTEPELWSIVARGLEKTREARWQDMFDLGKALAEWLVARGVEEDICHAALRARWLEPKRKVGGDVLHSFFPSGPPPDVATSIPVMPTSVPITLSGADSSSGVRLASSAPAPMAGAVTKGALPSPETQATDPRRRWRRWAITAIAPLIVLTIAAFARSLFRSRDAQPDAAVARAPETSVEARPVALDPLPAEAKVESAPPAPAIAASPPTSPAVGRASDPPGAASATPLRSAQDRAKPARRATPKRKTTELKDPFR